MAKNRKQDLTELEASPARAEVVLDPPAQELEVPRDLHRAVHLLCRASGHLYATQPRHPALAALERSVQFLVENRGLGSIYAPTLKVLADALALGPHHGEAAQDVRAAAEILRVG